MKKPPLPKHVTNVGVAALARETGLSEATISHKMKRGKSPDQIRQEAALRQSKIAAGKPVMGPRPKSKPPAKQSPGRPPTPSEYDLILKNREYYNAMEEAKLRRQKALAERQEIENMLRRGELMPVNYARTWMSRFLIEGRDELLKGPSEYADALAAESDPQKIAEILRGWLERAIAKWEQIEMLWKGNPEEQPKVA